MTQKKPDHQERPSDFIQPNRRKDIAKIERFYFQKLDIFLNDLPGLHAWQIIEVFDFLFNFQHLRISERGEVQWTI